MNEKISRRKFVKKTIYTGLAIGGAAVVGTAGYELFSKRSIDDLYGPYPDRSALKPLEIENTAAPKPNVIVIYCDDLGYNDLGCYGSKAIRTPNIDRLANEGMKFTDYYACNAVCAPSRAGLLTGRYPFRTGVIGNPYPADEPLNERLLKRIGTLLSPMGIVDLHEERVAEGLSDKELTIAQALKTVGYRTAMVGKWHLGDYSKQPQFNPLRHGFDRLLGVPHSNDMTPCPLYRDETELEADIGTNQARITGMYTDFALDFIEKSKDKPFFLYFAHMFPHQPLYASKKFAGKSKAGKFGDAVEEIDWSVGEIIKALHQHNIAQNTLIFFTSDNGPWFEGSAGEFKGRKGQSFEGGFRVPFIANWPGHIKSGSVSSEVVMNMDIFPTVLTLAGIGQPKDRIIDGKNFFGILSGQEKISPHDKVFFYHYDRLEGVRAGQWKYFRKTNRYTWPVPLDAEELPVKLGKKVFGERWPLLYDLSLDPGENYNVINTYPEIAKKMEDILVQWEQQTKKNPRGFLLQK